MTAPGALEPAGSDRPTFDVVFVCTGNRARSPLAAALLSRRLAHFPVRVTSVGTLDLGAVPALPDAIETAAALGLDLRSHRAQSHRGAGPDADLVLGFERHHVATAVVDWKAARERTFTLPEIVELLEGVALPAMPDPVRRARIAVETANTLRPKPATPAELPDPLGRPAAYYRELAERLTDLCDRLAAGLFGDATLSASTDAVDR
jgi:protein-tyrosine phosphatase